MTKFTLQAEAKGTKPIASYFICSRLQVRSVNLCNFCAFCFNIPRNTEIKINFFVVVVASGGDITFWQEQQNMVGPSEVVAAHCTGQ